MEKRNSDPLILVGKKVVMGPLIREFYENGKLVERTVTRVAALDADHWKGWQDYWNNSGLGKAYLKTAFDSRIGRNLMVQYSYTNDDLNRKHVYRRYFKFKPRLKKKKIIGSV